MQRIFRDETQHTAGSTAGPEPGHRRHRSWLVGGAGALLVLLVTGGTAMHTALTSSPSVADAGPAQRPTGSTQNTRNMPHTGAEDDGDIPDDRTVTPYDTHYSAVSRLDPALLKAVRKADADAKGAGTTFRVTSGWRSRAHQQRLLDVAVEEHGSLQAARQLVSTPEKSMHVRGKAIDIGPTDAADWLVQHGADYGLCQVYANEMWHFELLTSPGGTCPPLSADAAG